MSAKVEIIFHQRGSIATSEISISTSVGLFFYLKEDFSMVLTNKLDTFKLPCAMSCTCVRPIPHSLVFKIIVIWFNDRHVGSSSRCVHGSFYFFFFNNHLCNCKCSNQVMGEKGRLCTYWKSVSSEMSDHLYLGKISRLK